MLTAALCLLSPALAVSGPKLGLAMGVPEGAGEAEYLAAMRRQVRLGLDGNAFNLKWDEFEEQKGKPLADAVGMTKFTGQELVLTIGTIDTVKRRLPADVQNLSWSDPKLLTRFDAFLAQAIPMGGEGLRAVSLGNEVNVYLDQHRDETADYVRFLDHAQATVKRLNPKIKVGITLTCTDAIKSPDLARQIQGKLDAVFFTYYPMDGLRVQKPAAIPSHFQFMTRFAGSRPIYLQEIGYPSSTAVESSEELQSEFVRTTLAQIDRHPQIVFGSFFMESDFTKSLMSFFETYYGVADPKFLAFLGSLGLCNADGAPKLAWKTFCEEISRRRPLSDRTL